MIQKALQSYALTELSREDIYGKKILVRVDFNVPLTSDGTIEKGADWRIHASQKTIDYILERGGIPLLISHIGSDGSSSLLPVAEYLGNYYNVIFISKVTDIGNSLETLEEGDIVLFENIRRYPGELENNSDYLSEIIERCDLYVNEAFSVSHRKHASVYDVVHRLPSYVGIQFLEEVTNLSRFDIHHLPAQTTLVLGGAKFGTKLNLLKKFLPHIRYVLIGGALANLFLKERGFEIGASFVDAVDISDIVQSEKIVLPIDAVDQEGDIVRIDQVGNQDMILDTGPETGKLFTSIIEYSDLVLWNGPMGKYEDNYTEGSSDIARAIADSSAYSVTGGGDTSAVVIQEGYQDNFDFLSTGGGAMLDFLVEGTLPGIEAILKKQ